MKKSTRRNKQNKPKRPTAIALEVFCDNRLELKAKLISKEKLILPLSFTLDKIGFEAHTLTFEKVRGRLLALKDQTLVILAEVDLGRGFESLQSSLDMIDGRDIRAIRLHVNPFNPVLAAGGDL